MSRNQLSLDAPQLSKRRQIMVWEGDYLLHHQSLACILKVLASSDSEGGRKGGKVKHESLQLVGFATMCL